MFKKSCERKHIFEVIFKNNNKVVQRCKNCGHEHTTYITNEIKRCIRKQALTGDWGEDAKQRFKK